MKPPLVPFFFPNADDGGGSFISAASSQVVSWSTTQIEVEVPAKAGTGQFVVQTHLGDATFSATSLTINYSQLNPSFSGVIYEPQLIDEGGTSDPGDGGYYFNYSTGTANGGVDITSVAGATDAIDRAAATWQAGSGLSFYAGIACQTVTTQLPSSSGSGDDGTNLITFDSDHNGGAGWDLDVQASASTLAVMYSLYSLCGAVGHLPEVVDLDMVIRRDGTGVNWEYGPGLPSGGEHDLETIALHEFGHGTQLAHVIASGTLMHFAASSGTTVRTLGTNDDDGSTYVMSHSLAYNPPIGGCGGGDFGEARQIQSYTASHECNQLLPVELIDFTGRKINEGVQLQWSTATEIDNDFFTLERSRDGRVFETISIIQGAGTTSQVSDYSYLDKAPFSGINYYRLWQTDFDGGRENLGTVVVEYEFDEEISIFPNPVYGNTLYINYTADELAAIQLNLRDITGKNVWSTQDMVEKGSQTIPLIIPSVASGIYFLEVLHAGRSVQHKVLIHRRD